MIMQLEIRRKEAHKAVLLQQKKALLERKKDRLSPSPLRTEKTSVPLDEASGDEKDKEDQVVVITTSKFKSVGTCQFPTAASSLPISYLFSVPFSTRCTTV
jgi:hypothetical protein